jgi:protein TonB
MEKDSRKRSIEAEDDSETESAKAAKRKMLLTGAGVGSVLLLGFLVGMIYHASHLDTEGAKQPARPDITVANLPKPSPETPLEPRPATQQTVQQTAQQTPQIDASLSATASTQTPRAPKVESAMMDDQLNAPTRIPTDLKSAPAKETPPSPGFGPAGLDGLGSNGSGVFGTVFGTQTKPRVKVEPTKVEKISAGVAVGLLTRKTAPIYPPIAKSAGVQGTVMLQAVISKSGTIENVHVVSGPAMLQQAAMDAVRTWRYKPYLLDNQPVEVETTVDVIFNLGR